MSGHRPFTELTKDFTPEHWKHVREASAELDIALSLYESPDERERRWKTRVSSVPVYRSGRMSSNCKVKPRLPVFVRLTQRTETGKKPISIKGSYLTNEEKLIAHPLQLGTESRFRRLYMQSSNQRRELRMSCLSAVR